MTTSKTATTPYVIELRSSLPAAVITLALAYLLRFTTWPVGPRMAGSFFVFILLQAILRDRVTGERAGALGWAFTVAVAVITGLAMWFIADL